MDEQPQFGPELRRLRTAAGLSLADLSAVIHYSKGYLSKVETGAAQANHALATLCDTALDTGGTLVRIIPRIRREKGRPRTATPLPSWLPAVTVHFKGRAEELDRICAPGATVCVVDGMAGVGKSALAVLAARHLEPDFPDGCLFLDLHGYSGEAEEVSSTEALDRFLRALGLPGEQIPADMRDRAALYRGQLRGRRVLVVLDNARSAGQVVPLLPAEPGCRVLVTSRNRLTALDDARHVSLGALPEPEAVSLFRSVSGVESEQGIERIVGHCGRLPLAVRIAAARLRANPIWTLDDLDRRLADQTARLAELDDGERSVAATFQLSYDDLPTAQRRMLGLLALYPGRDFDAQSAGALAGLATWQARQVLDRLHDSHLLLQRPMDRYQFHDLLRAFASARALPELTRQERQVAVVTLVDHTLHALEQVDKLLTPQRFRPRLTYDHLPVQKREFADQSAAMSWAVAEWPNFVALCGMAADEGMHARCWQLAFVMREFFFRTKLCDQWVQTHRRAVIAARLAADRWAEATTLSNLGMAHLHRGELDLAAEHYREALAAFTEIDDEHGAFNTLANQAWVNHYRGDHDAALRELLTALEFYQRSSADRNAAITLRGIALVRTELGEFAESARHAAEALVTFIRLELNLDAAMTLNCLGWNHFRAGDHEAAADSYRRASVLAVESSSPFEQARAETGLGNVEAAADRVSAAKVHWERAEALHPDLHAITVGEVRARLATRVLAG